MVWFCVKDQSELLRAEDTLVKEGELCLIESLEVAFRHEEFAVKL
jgi:hypothetical protein